MKLSIMAVFISVISFSSFASNSSDISAAKDAVTKAQSNLNTAQAAVDAADASAHDGHTGVNAWAAASQAAGEQRAQAQADLRAAEANLQNLQAQKDVPFSTAIGGHNHSDNRSHNEHGTGNGSNNAANSHSAHGLGGSAHVGGGRSDGGFHY